MKTKKIPKTFFMNPNIHVLSSITSLHYRYYKVQEQPPQMFTVQFYLANSEFSPVSVRMDILFPDYNLRVFRYKAYAYISFNH